MAIESKKKFKNLCVNSTPLAAALVLAFPMWMVAAPAHAQNLWLGSGSTDGGTPPKPDFGTTTTSGDGAQVSNWAGPLVRDWTATELLTATNVVNTPKDDAASSAPNKAPSWTVTWPGTSPYTNSTQMSVDSYIALGSGSGESGYLFVDAPQQNTQGTVTSTSVAAGKTPYALVVGEKEGAGELDIKGFTAYPDMSGEGGPNVGLRTDNLAVGLNGTGVVNLTGNGKDTGWRNGMIQVITTGAELPADEIAEQLSPALAVGVGSTAKGTVNVQNAWMFAGQTQGNPAITPKEPTLLVGDAQGVGLIDVVGGGKLTGGFASGSMGGGKPAPTDRVVIGRDGGTGTVQVDSTSRLRFALGTQVGQNGGNGTIRMLGEGKLDLATGAFKGTSDIQSCPNDMDGRYALTVGGTGTGRVEIDGPSGSAHLLGKGKYGYSIDDPVQSPYIYGLTYARMNLGQGLVDKDGVITVSNGGSLGVGVGSLVVSRRQDDQGIGQILLA